MMMVISYDYEDKPISSMIDMQDHGRFVGRGALSYKRLTGMCRWMGSHFHNWIDYHGVAFSIELLEWGHTFSVFLGKTFLHIYGKQMYQNVCTAGEK